MRLSPKTLRALLVIAAALAVYAVRHLPSRQAGEVGDSGLAAGNAAIAEAFRDRRSDLWVEGAGEVERVLADDREGSPHQRFIVRLDGGQTVLVAHNLELAERVPLDEGDELGFRGEYEWNERGGVVHWTHHDPQGRHQGGWIRHRGRTYR